VLVADGDPPVADPHGRIASRRYYLINLGIPGEFLPDRLDTVRPDAMRG
jgi:hypothetical protein